jgi:hypothetical protein
MRVIAKTFYHPLPDIAHYKLRKEVRAKQKRELEEHDQDSQILLCSDMSNAQMSHLKFPLISAYSCPKPTVSSTAHVNFCVSVS